MVAGKGSVRIERVRTDLSGAPGCPPNRTGASLARFRARGGRWCGEAHGEAGEPSGAVRGRTVGSSGEGL